ncbi:DUF3077 domain-containing protein [Pseudomonas sp.]|uniref:DUF3077 domain-containing protein n=1 Tax=Pseudomonas sp. TaxID=306 RepID=UPI003FD8DAB3
MSHPKNTTAPQKAQQPLLTTATEFMTAATENRHPFAVQAGIPAAEALSIAYELLGAVDGITTACIDREADAYALVAIRFLAASSQALVLACATSIEQGGAQ